MNEATQASIEALSAVEEAIAPRRFERRHTVELPIPETAAERVAHSPVDAIDATLAERKEVHGDFSDDAKIAQALKYVMRQSKNWEDMPPTHREALENMQTKVARILAGDFNHPDHWKDLQGYPRLVETRL